MTPRNRIFPFFVPHAGCPNSCVFCNQRRISGEKQSDADAKALCSALSFLPKGAGFELAFYGGSFTAIPQRQRLALLEAVLPFLSDKTIRSLRVSTRPDCISGKALDELSRYGVETIELGAQSMDDAVLCAAGRGHTALDCENASRMIKERGFKLVLQMMTGLPKSSDASDIRTAERIAALGPDGVRIYPTVVIRDTPLYDMWLRGEYGGHTAEHAAALCARILPVFGAAGIAVIRLGLNPTDELSGGAAAAGAYHPAFGELVMSELALEKARALLQGAAPYSRVTLGVNPACVSRTVGHKRRNVQALCEEFGFLCVKVRAIDLPEDKIVILDIAK